MKWVAVFFLFFTMCTQTYGYWEDNRRRVDTDYKCAAPGDVFLRKQVLDILGLADVYTKPDGTQVYVFKEPTVHLNIRFAAVEMCKKELLENKTSELKTKYPLIQELIVEEGSFYVTFTNGINISSNMFSYGDWESSIEVRYNNMLLDTLIRTPFTLMYRFSCYKIDTITCTAVNDALHDWNDICDKINQLSPMHLEQTCSELLAKK